MTGWVSVGGCFLGTKRTLPGDRLPEIAAKIKELNIQGILIIGGFEVCETFFKYLLHTPFLHIYYFIILYLPGVPRMSAVL